MLLMQILDQVKPEKGGINWDLINLPGRTKKACQNTWHKFTAHHKQQMEGLGDKNGGNTPSPAKAKGTPGRCLLYPPRSASETLTLLLYQASRKRKPKKEQVKAEEEDDDEDAPTPTKKPRGRKYICLPFSWCRSLTAGRCPEA